MSSQQQLYPLVFEPIYKDYVWGGDKILRRFNRASPARPAEIVAESWEISDRPEGRSSVANGPLAGATLGELVGRHGEGLLGRGRNGGAFPLLVKIIDARERLSVQVHPDEESAARVGGEPKTEMWVVLDADPGAILHAGFKEPCSEMALRAAVDEGTVQSLLKPLAASPGGVLYVPGGRIHCIGAGCMLLEVQQSSDTTYRVHDWGRVGHDGKPRELHIEKAMRVIRWDDTGPDVTDISADGRVVRHEGATRVVELLDSHCFRVERVELSKCCSCSTDGTTFHILFVERGSIDILSGAPAVEAGPGTSVLIPACVSDYRLAGQGADLLRISLPAIR